MNRFLQTTILVPMTLMVALAIGNAAVGQQQTEPQDPRPIAKKIEDAGQHAQGQWFVELGKIGTDEAFLLLKKSCDDIQQQSRLHRSAFQGFLHFRGNEKLEKRSLRYLQKQAFSGVKRPSRAAVVVLSMWGPTAHGILEDIVRKGEEPIHRAIAIGPLLPGFCKSKDAKRLDLLLSYYTIPTSGNIELFANSLSQVPRKKLLPRLEDWLSERVPSALLEGAIQAIIRMDGDDVDQLLHGLLDSKSSVVVFHGLQELRRRNSQGHLKELNEVLRDKEDPMLRYLAMTEKGRLLFGESKWEPYIGQLIASYDPVERQAAATAVSHLVPSEAWPILQRLMVDESRSVRIQSLITIGGMRIPESVPALIDRLIAEEANGELVLRNRIVEVLTGLTGQSFETASHTWHKWWDNEGENFVFPTQEELLKKAREREARLNENTTVGSFYGLPVVSKRAVFIVDQSGSMNAAAKTSRYTGEKTSTRLGVAKAQLKLALENYADGGMFNVVYFDSYVSAWEKKLVKMTKATRDESIKWSDRHRPRGGTAIYDALEFAFAQEGLDTIYLLTDGQPSGGKINNGQRIRELVRQWNAVKHITIHCVAIGGENGLLRGLAEDTGGLMTVVE
jgi:hypothetical protein